MFSVARLFGDRIGRRGMVELVDMLKRRGVSRLSYLHCQQFAPWRATLQGKAQELATAREDAARIERFAEFATVNEHSRRLTLFYQPHLALASTKNRPEVRRAAAADPIGFGRSTEVATEFRAQTIRQLLAASAHELQLGLDPVGMVWSPMLRDDELSAKLARPEVRVHDVARYELALQLALQGARHDSGTPFAAWLFSRAAYSPGCDNLLVVDPEGESATLERNGCIGDFSADVAGDEDRSIYGQPVLIRPLAASRAWEMREAEPERARGNAWAAAEKLFMWAAGGAESLALDGGGARLLVWAQRLIKHSMVIDGELWLTTRSRGWPMSGTESPLPHDRASVRRVLDAIFEAAHRVGATTRQVTASEAYRAIVGGDSSLGEGSALSVPETTAARRAAGRLARREMIGLLAIDEVMSSIATMGLKESGATEFYQARAEKGQMIAPYEPQIAELLTGLRPKLDRVFEVGSGASVLAMLCAANGLAAEGIDRQPHRIGLAQRILERLVAKSGALPTACELRRGRAPQALRRVDGRNAALVFTNMIGSLSDAEEAELIKRAAGFRIVIVDLARFVRVRDAAGQAALLDQLRAAGLGEPLLLAGFTSFRVFLRQPPRRG